ncbi:MAG: hypothetical protein HRT90_08115 [Candidatus Margulisbacteria bacterium]|nr:hypothetical protein [Candidatus Margulisiibacteriota bacterium]
MRAKTVGILSLFFALGVMVILLSPQTSIHKITFRGAQFIERPSLISHFKTLSGKPLLYPWVARGFIRNSYIKFPQIKKITFGWKYPRQINVHITEKKASVMYFTKEYQYIVSEDGTILSKDGHLGGFNSLPIISGIPEEAFRSFHISDSLRKKTSHIIENMSFYVDHHTLQMVFQPNNTLILLKDDVLPIKIGRLTNLDKKFKNLNQYYQSGVAGEKFLQYIDLRITDKVVVKYETGS